jgi:hypothetical protein
MNAELLARQHLCSRKLADIAKTMGIETKRLNHYVSLLPSSNISERYDLPSGKEFEWLFGPDALKTPYPSSPEQRKERDAGLLPSRARGESSDIRKPKTVKSKETGSSNNSAEGQTARARLDTRLGYTSITPDSRKGKI